MLLSTFFFHPAKQTAVSSHCLLFSDRLPRASQLSQKLGFQLSFALLVKKAASSHSVRFDFCVSARACERACVHVEVNTSNLGLKERSVFCSRPSIFHRPTTTDVHLDDSAAEVLEGETRRSAATRGHAGGEINYCSRRWSRSGFARCTWFALLRVQNWWHLQEEVMHFYFVHCRVLPYCWMLVTSLATRGVSLMIHRLKLRRLVFYFSA